MIGLLRARYWRTTAVTRPKIAPLLCVNEIMHQNSPLIISHSDLNSAEVDLIHSPKSLVKWEKFGPPVLA